MATSVAEVSIAEARRVVVAGLRPHRAKVFLFGSRVVGGAREGSDIDVAVLPLEPLPPGTLAEIRDALEESTVPYRVDLVDLDLAPSSLRDRVLREGIPWTD
jgi:uncharacterized protein